MEPLKFENGKPSIPVLNDQTMPGFFSSRQDKVRNNDTRLRIFSGTANPSLSQVNTLKGKGNGIVPNSLFIYFYIFGCKKLEI